jgi:hypothetical protein
MVSDTSSQSLGCRGKDAEDDLQDLTAQVRKFRVRSFIFGDVRRGRECVGRVGRGVVFGC